MDVGILYFLKLWLDYLGISNFRTTPNLILLKCLFLLSGEGISRLATRPSCFNRWSETCKAPSTPWSQKSSIQERSFNEHQLVYAGRWVTLFFLMGISLLISYECGGIKNQTGFQHQTWWCNPAWFVDNGRFGYRKKKNSKFGLSLS